MADASAASPAGRPRLLFYAMYDPAGLDSAPKVRIAMMGAALERTAAVEQIQGGRTTRARAAWAWLRSGGIGRVDAVYVESSTSTATPFDLGLLAWARLRGRPVGVYFRDAYQLHRDLFPVRRFRQRVADLVWRLTMPLLRRLATVRFVPSTGLAEVLGLGDAVLLPPGTDPTEPDLGVAPTHLVAAILAPTRAAGFEILRAAVEDIRLEFPDTRLRLITSVAPSGALPDWIELIPGGRPVLAGLLEAARVCVIPLPRTRYTDLAVPVRLADLVAFGKPIIVTDTTAVRAYLGSSGAAMLVLDTADAISAAIGRIFRDDHFAAGLARSARAFSEAPSSTWPARAGTVVSSLVGGAP